MLLPLKMANKEQGSNKRAEFGKQTQRVKVHLQILKLVNPRVQQLDNLSLARLHGALRLQMVLVALIRLERPLIITIRRIGELPVTPTVHTNIINAHRSRGIVLLAIERGLPLDAQREIKTGPLLSLAIILSRQSNLYKHVSRLTIALLHRRERDLVLH